MSGQERSGVSQALPDRLMGVTGLIHMMRQVVDGVIKRATTTSTSARHRPEVAMVAPALRLSIDWFQIIAELTHQGLSSKAIAGRIGVPKARCSGGSRAASPGIAMGGA